MADGSDMPAKGANHTAITLPFRNPDGDLPYLAAAEGDAAAEEAAGVEGGEWRFVSPLSSLSFQADLSLLRTLWLLDRPHVLLAAYCHQVNLRWNM